MGNDEKYSVSGVGTVIFQREHGSRLTLTDVKYVPRLKRNLVLITMLEDRGYDVVFSKGKVFLRHIITRQVKQIGSRVKNLYALKVQDACKALSSKETDGDLVAETEWYITSQHAEPEEVSEDCGGATIGVTTSRGCRAATTGEVCSCRGDQVETSTHAGDL